MNTDNSSKGNRDFALLLEEGLQYDSVSPLIGPPPNPDILWTHYIKWINFHTTAKTSIFHRSVVSHKLDISVLEVINNIKSNLGNDFIVTYISDEICQCFNNDYYIVSMKSDTNYVSTRFYTHEAKLKSIDNLKIWNWKEDIKHKIHWFYAGSRGNINSHVFDLNTQNKAVEEFYPWLEGKSLKDFYEDYAANSASIMLLMGAAGTGKTTLIRNFISHMKQSAMFTFDEQVMKSDEFFVNFLSSDEKNILIIEDADLLITSRENAGNRIISKFLNVSEGLIKLNNKKIIFSTNLTKLRDVDEALIRPGRCYDVIKFDSLTLDQANKVALKCGVEPLTEDKEYTIAEIFNRNKINHIKHKLGF